MQTVTVDKLVPGMVIKQGDAELVIASNTVITPYYTSPPPSRTSRPPLRTIRVFRPEGGVSEVNLPGEVTVLKRKHPMKGITLTDASISCNTGTTAGTDPEILTVNAAGEVIPSWEFLPSKDNPVATHYHSKAFWDGFQSEFTVTPVTCHGHFVDYVRSGLQTVITQARKHDPTARLTIKSAIRIPREKLMGYDPEHVQLGCSPSLNVYGEPPLALPDPTELEYRFAGCHLHYGSSQITPDKVDQTIRLLDATAGMANVALGGEFLCPERRQWYGKAGEYRYHEKLSSDHRLEWRVPDTILLSHPATFNLLIDFARQAARFGAAGLGFLWDAEEQEVRDAVNYCDVELARKILKRNHNLTVMMLKRQYYGPDICERGFEAFMNGIQSVVADPTAVEANWELLDKYTGGQWHSGDYDRSCKAGKMWQGAVVHRLAMGELV